MRPHADDYILQRAPFRNVVFDLERLTAEPHDAARELVTAERLREYCTATVAQDAQLLDAFNAAIAWAEGDKGCNFAITERAFTWRLPWFPASHAIDLAITPVRSITSVHYRAPGEEADTLLSPSRYTLHGRRYLRPRGEGWPRVDDELAEEGGAVTVIFRAGWAHGEGETAETIPDDMRLGLLMLTYHWYETRGEDVPNAVDALLSKYRGRFA